MLHCNMKLAWQTSYASLTSEILYPRSIEDFDRRSGGGESFKGPNEITRSGYSEMSCQGSTIGPLFDEQQPKRVLTIDMHGVRQATRLKSRAAHVLEA